MPSPSKPGANWRPGRSAPVRSATAVPAAPLPAWRQMAPPTPIPPRVRVARLAGVLGLILGTATLLIWLILWLAPPGPACLVIAAAGYEDNLAFPAYPQGREGMSRLARLAGTSSPLSWFFRRAGRLRLAGPPQEFRRATDWAKGLDEAREQTAIVFLALHGGADAKGAYLLPQDASADPGDRVRLEAVLDRLAQLPDGKHKLLVLDATAMTADWALGLLNNDFARGLADLDEKIATIPNLVVISASGIDQRSWPAADLRTTLFARHLFEGLLGGADDDRNGRLHAWDLFQYVARHVEADALRLHGVTQTPVLLPTKGGEDRARALAMTFQLEESALEGEPIGDPLSDIQHSWATYDAFRPSAPAARACVPGAWALWQAWLVRYEQVRLAGSPLASKVGEQVREAGQRVRQGLDLSLVSGSLTLAMPAVQGETQLIVPESYAPMERLWQANVADRRAVWQSLRQGDSDGMLRRNVLFALIRRAAENPARNLDRAAALVKLLDDPLSVVRPAEAHFLVMLDRDLAVRPMPDELNAAVREGLRVRLLAEQAALAVEGQGYAYAERIRPWISSLILDADTLRQQGQDLLFANDRVQWQKAQALLEKAAVLYQQARDDTVGLRECLTVCDRAVAELPIYARWLAHLTDDPNDGLLDRASKLFGEVRQLESMATDLGPQRDAGKIAAIRKKAQAAQSALDDLQSRLDAYARTCETTRASPLRDGGVALQVPWLDAGVRGRLLLKLTRLAKQARSESEANVEVSPGQLDEIAQKRAVREGRLALAALGHRWFDALPGGMPYGDVEPFLRRPDLEGAWSKVLRWAGDQLGARFRRYPVRVGQLVADARKQQQVTGPLGEADRLERRLDAGQWQVATVDAPVLARRADVETLLVWQATRTFTDHWYNDDPAGTPYYRITGIDYLRDARRLDPFGRSDAPGAEVVRKELEAPGGLSVAASPARPMIAGDILRLGASLKATSGSVATGHPLLWAVPGDRLTFAQPKDAERAVVPIAEGAVVSNSGITFPARLPVALRQDADHLTVSLTSPELQRAEEAPPLDAHAEGSDVNWYAYYRGQKPAATTPVQLYPVAESTRNDYPPPNRAGVAVRASEQLFADYGRAQGGLVIVMDCSGSLGPAATASGSRAINERPAAEARTRFRQAVNALRRVLGQVPRGTRLSLWTFGQAVPPRNTVERAEDTIQQLRAPATWTGGSGDIDALVGQVEALEPWNQSPIAVAMLRAREDIVRTDGFRTMIVISDGDDNRFANDRQDNPNKEPIPELLGRRFAGTGIAINFVGFTNKEGQPEAELLNNFNFVTTRTPKGTVCTVTNLPPLITWMRQNLYTGLRYRLSPMDGDGASVEVSHEQENDRWQFVPGSDDGYRLRVPLMNFDRRMTLRHGDFVLLDLERGDPGWRRLTWSRQDAYRLRPARQSGGWRVAVMQDQLLGERALQMLVSLEKESPRAADPGQVYPGAVWLEVAPAGVKATPAVRWGEVYGYPAPAWGVDAPGWPMGAAAGPPSPNLGTWWGSPSSTSSVLLRRPADFDQLVELRSEQTIGKHRFTIDKATVEQHWVEVAPNRRDKRWCLVIGVAYSAGSPAWVAPQGLSALAGQEHRQFLAAGRYVGLFWFRDATTEDAVRKKLGSLTGVRLVSAAAFKEEAAQQMQSATFTNLDSPAALPPRPRPVWSPP